jgi:hypothetical protein
MIGMLLTYIFDSKIIHDKGGHDGSPFVSPEARRVDTLIISVWGKLFPEEFVC